MINIIIFHVPRGNIADYPADREAEKRKAKAVLLSRFSQNPVYLGYDLEMRQLCRIKQELLWRPSVSIVCMDYQAKQ